MSFFSAKLIPHVLSPQDVPLRTVNRYANHVSKTASAIDVVTREEIGLEAINIAGSGAATSALLPFSKVAAENGDDSKEENACGCVTSSNANATVEDTTITPQAMGVLANIAGVIVANGSTLVFTPIVTPTATTDGTSSEQSSLPAVLKQKTVLSAPLPSGHPIVSITRLASPPLALPAAKEVKEVVGQKRSRDDDCASHAAAVSHIVVDGVGNVYLLKNLLAALNTSNTVRKAHVEKATMDASTALVAEPATPTLIASSAAQELMTGGLPSYSLGAGGWVGTAIVSATTKAEDNNTNTATSEVIIAVGREHARDVRVIRFDTNAAIAISDGIGTVIGSFYPTHGPTSIAVLANNSSKDWEYLVAVANGPLVTFYDVSLGKGKAAISSSSSAEGKCVARAPTVLKNSLRSPFSIVTLRSNVWSVTSVKSITAAPPTMAAASPSCLAPASFLWTAGSDRSVSLYDACRNFMKVHAAPNVLKYDAVSAALASPPGNDVTAMPVHVAVSGVDCEVRGIDHLESRSATVINAAKEKEKKEKDTAAAKEEAVTDKAATTNNSNGEQATAPDTHNPSSFRGRLNSAIHGDDVWVGGWRSFSTADGVAYAVGLTRVGTLYVVA